MRQTPGQRNSGLFTGKEMLISAVQDIIIAAGTLFVLLVYEQQAPAWNKQEPLFSSHSYVAAGEFWLCFAVVFASVMWFEIYKTDLLKIKSWRLKH
jgi:hypothetical protein